MVGASLACALSGQGLRIAMIEALQPEMRSEAGYDDRAIALAYGTRQIFSGLQLWDRLASRGDPHPPDPCVGPRAFRHGAHGSRRRRAAGDWLCRAGTGDRPGAGEAVSRTEGVDSWCPATVTAVHRTAAGVELDISCEGFLMSVDTRLIVAADGADSLMREQFGIGHIEQRLWPDGHRDQYHAAIATQQYCL